MHGSDLDPGYRSHPGDIGDICWAHGVLDRLLALSASAPSLVVTACACAVPTGTAGPLLGALPKFLLEASPPRPPKLPGLCLCQPSPSTVSHPTHCVSLGWGLWADCRRPSIAGSSWVPESMGQTTSCAPCQPPTRMRPQVPDLQTEKCLCGGPRLQQPGNHTPGDSCESTSTPRALPKSVLFEQQPEFTLRQSPGGAVKGLGGESDGSGCHQQLVGARSLPGSPHPTALRGPGAVPTQLAPVLPCCSRPVVAGGCGVEKDWICQMSIITD